MSDFYSRRMIEALRSGVSSRDVGQCFTSARPRIMRQISDALDKLADDRLPDGMIISGKYGEGKTHLLNTVWSMAHQNNMAVSIVTLSKETPLSSMHMLYQKVLQGTYLPGQVQPGLLRALDTLTAGAPFLPELYEFCLTGLETNRLYYVLKAFTATQDDEEKFQLLGDIEGEFLTNSRIRQIYRRVYGESAVFNTGFAKSKHTTDYFAFLSRLLLALGYNGWVLLFDEAELTGRLGKKARLRAYENMSELLAPKRIGATYCLFAFNASYVPDVIEAKHEDINLKEALLPAESKSAVENVLTRIVSAPQLVPLDREETLEIMQKICRYHGTAYDWEPSIDAERLLRASERHGYLLRTRIRTAVELLDQLYQYGDAGEIRINELGQLTFDEDGSATEELS